MSEKIIDSVMETQISVTSGEWPGLGRGVLLFVDNGTVCIEAFLPEQSARNLANALNNLAAGLAVKKDKGLRLVGGCGMADHVH